MRKSLDIALAFCLFFSVNSVILAQTTSFQPSPHIYKIKVGECIQTPTERVLTGFRVKNLVGIVTALHGVLGCNTIIAEPSTGVNVFRNLIIGQVDVRRDMALLWSEELSKLRPDGLNPIQTANNSDFIGVRAIGYPLNASRQKPTVDVKVLETTELGDLLPSETVISAVAERASPALDTKVLSLQAPIVPGHSGAPLINRNNYLVGVANGGLDLGRVDMAWAIPWPVEWKIVSPKVSQQVSWADAQSLKSIEKIDPNLLFSFSTPEPASITPVQIEATAIPRAAVVKPTTKPIVPSEDLIRIQHDGIEATSYYNVDRVPENIFDQRENTFWMSKFGSTVGESIKITFREPKTVNRVGIYRQKNIPEFAQVKEAALIFADGSRQKISFKGYDGWEEVDIDPVTTDLITFEVTNAYPQASVVVIHELTYWGIVNPAESSPTVVSKAEELTRLQYDGIEATSYYNVNLVPENIFDQHEDTLWMGKFGSTVGESIKTAFREPKTVNRISIYRQKNVPDAAQVKEATLIFADGSRQKINFKGYNGWEDVDINPVTTDSITFEVVSAYPQASVVVIYELTYWGSENRDEPLPVGPSNSEDFIRLQHDGIEATSYYNVDRIPENIFDQSEDTFWMSKFGSTVGESIKINFREPKTVNRISIYRQKNIPEFAQVKEATLIFADGSRQKISFKGYDGWEDIDIDPINTDSITFEVISAYPQASVVVIHELTYWGFK